MVYTTGTCVSASLYSTKNLLLQNLTDSSLKMPTSASGFNPTELIRTHKTPLSAAVQYGPLQVISDQSRFLSCAALNFHIRSRVYLGKPEVGDIDNITFFAAAR